jgi:hypothetical protein
MNISDAGERVRRAHLDFEALIERLNGWTATVSVVLKKICLP